MKYLSFSTNGKLKLSDIVSGKAQPEIKTLCQFANLYFKPLH